MVVELAGVPAGKGRPRFVRATGHAYTPDKTRRYESDLRYAGQEAMKGRPPFAGPVRMTVEAFLPVPASWSEKKRRAALAGLVYPTSRPDLDNYEKAAADSLNEIVFRDDSQVVARGPGGKVYSDRPRLVVTITELV